LEKGGTVERSRGEVTPLYVIENKKGGEYIYGSKAERMLLGPDWV